LLYKRVTKESFAEKIIDEKEVREQIDLGIKKCKEKTKK
jgi:hypothetical protein